MGKERGLTVPVCAVGGQQAQDVDAAAAVGGFEDYWECVSGRFDMVGAIEGGGLPHVPSPSTPISRPVSCQYLTIAGVLSMIVPSMSKSRAEKSRVVAGAEKSLSS